MTGESLIIIIIRWLRFLLTVNKQCQFPHQSNVPDLPWAVLVLGPLDTYPPPNSDGVGGLAQFKCAERWYARQSHQLCARLWQWKHSTPHVASPERPICLGPEPLAMA